MSVALLRDLAATPRQTGSDAIAAARARVARALEELGFETREAPFEFSAFPGSFATPLLGVAVALMVGTAAHWGSRGQRWVPLLVLVLSWLALAFAARWLSRRGVVSLRFMRRRGINLVATRPHGAEPAVWLCAHLDTKSQPVPTLVRAACVGLLMIGFDITLVLAIVSAIGMAIQTSLWAAAALVTLAGAIPVVMSVVTSHSPGALDNASGVATVVEAAQRLGAGAGVGVVITDAEELGLAGARVWAAAQRPEAVLNCDGVDDAGDNVVILGRNPGRIQQALPGGLRTLRVLPGVLTDAIAFADAGAASVTFMRGRWTSLARVHSRRDDLARLSGTGIAEVAALMASTAERVGSRGNR